MQLKTPYIATKVNYTENHTFKAGVNFIRGNTNYWRWKPVGNYRVKLNQNQIDGIKNSGVGGDLNVNDIPQDAQVLNYNVELRPASLEQIKIFIRLMWKIYGRLLVV
jgi:hypothetical protein